MEGITEKQAVLADVENQAGKPFKYEDNRAQARAKCADLDEKLKASIEPAKPVQADVPDTAERLIRCRPGTAGSTS